LKDLVEEGEEAEVFGEMAGVVGSMEGRFEG
jgi:hypothetical protein